MEKFEKSWGQLLYHPRIRAVIYQVILVLLLTFLLITMTRNAISNLNALGVKSGFDFLSQEAGFSIISSVIPFDETSSYFRAFLVGVTNTIILAVAGIFIATVLGFTIGIMRLSKNWLASRIALTYIETVRNVPLLLQIFLWYHAVLKPLSSARNIYTEGEAVWFSLTNSGLQIPVLVPEPGTAYVWYSILCALAVGFGLNYWNRQRQSLTGKVIPVVRISIAILIIFPLLTLVLLGFPGYFEPATMGRFRPEGGITIIPELIAMLIALSVYTAAFIAEVVRAGIQAVSKGQTEAGLSLGLRRGQLLRLVVVPQALRVIIPPLTNQYLNLTKNSSLAAAIAYPELVSVFAGTALNQSGKVFEILGMTLFIYLMLSLITSVLMNWYNHRVRIIER